MTHNDFQLKYPFPFLILRFLLQNHIALLKDRFLKKMLLKRAKTHRLKHFYWKLPHFLSPNDPSFFELILSPKDPYFLNSWFTCTSLYTNNVSRDISTLLSLSQSTSVQGPETLYRRPIQILIAKRHRGVGAMSYIISASHVACSTCLIIQRTRKLFKGPVNLTY